MRKNQSSCLSESLASLWKFYLTKRLSFSAAVKGLLSVSDGFHCIFSPSLSLCFAIPLLYASLRCIKKNKTSPPIYPLDVSSSGEFKRRTRVSLLLARQKHLASYAFTTRPPNFIIRDLITPAPLGELCFPRGRHLHLLVTPPHANRPPPGAGQTSRACRPAALSPCTQPRPILPPSWRRSLSALLWKTSHFKATKSLFILN